MRIVLLLALLVHDSWQLKVSKDQLKVQLKTSKDLVAHPALVDEDMAIHDADAELDNDADVDSDSDRLPPQCTDPSIMIKQIFPDKEQKFKMEAMTPDRRWKMKDTLVALTDEDIANCGTCNGIREEIYNVKKDRIWNHADMQPRYTISKIFYINPSFASGRRKRIEQRLQNTTKGYWIPIQRWNAATRGDASPQAIAEFTRKGIQAYVGDNKGTVAVYLSHARLLKAIYNSDPDGEDVYIIFEDDASLPQGWPDKVLGLLETNVPEDWDIFKFGYDPHSQGTSKREYRISQCVKEAHGTENGLQAYAVRPKSIPKLLDQLRSQQLYDVDGALHGSYRQIHKVNETTGQTMYSSKGLNLYKSLAPIVHHDNRGSLRLASDDIEEEELGTEQDHKAMQKAWNTAAVKAWPGIQKEWETAVEDARQEFGLHSTIVEESVIQ
eukprot:gnl/MRDRNA2_/MRDRNA2_38131_c0_seq1.p1 gnl/MRDRNA2_/MRDRNA2_38131_c0~~gnl/MRDRNA2_/MRDRNA2_38131_c0_seq1.p1  ORF type:complete len:439 (-),score=87.74 gnl/MRDRNA2_/MRDRNA2_38131_c0_seq1:309-1625(-)